MLRDSVGKASLKVTKDKLASSIKTGNVKVLSTSYLLGLMEEAACKALDTQYLLTGQTSVSATMNIHHKRPSPLGSTVTAIARVTDIDTAGIRFEIDAFDETGLVGTGDHKRVFVDKDEFEKNCYSLANDYRKIES